jgi:type II secretory pathway pseudopilin PulG
MRARKNRAFFVETLIVTFLLLLMLSILVRIFGAAALKSRFAARRTQAAQVAQNITAMFEAGEGRIGEAQQNLIDEANDEYSDDETPQTSITLFFDESGLQSENGPYQVNLMMTCEVRAVGYMITGNMSIVNVQDPDEDLAQLDTAVYFPDAVDAVLSGDEEIDFGDISVIDTGDSDSADGAEDSLTQAGAETASSQTAITEAAS